jgi:ferrous iron transport protein A
MAIARSPGRDIKSREASIKFSEINERVSARVVAIKKATPETLRLQEMGLTLGAIFKVEKIAPFGDPIEISVRGYRLCLRKREAFDIEVEIIREVA